VERQGCPSRSRQAMPSPFPPGLHIAGAMRRGSRRGRRLPPRPGGLGPQTRNCGRTGTGADAEIPRVDIPAMDPEPRERLRDSSISGDDWLAVELAQKEVKGQIGPIVCRTAHYSKTAH